MKPRIDPTPELLSLAAIQGGVVTAEQAVAHGVGRNSVARLVGTGIWQRLDPGIYATREPDWTSRAWAGVLIGGESARLGGLAAGHLHGLCDDPPELILVHIDHEVRRTNRGPWRFRRELPGKQYARPRGAPPRISIEDLVLDLVDAGSDDPRRRGAVHWISIATQRGLTTPPRLRRALLGRTRMHDRRLVEDLLADVAEGVQSPLELRYRNDVERAHGLPTGTRQAARRSGRLEPTARSFRDVYYDDFALVVELDGKAGHVERGRLRDLRRDNVTALRGERTLRYGWFDITEEPCLSAYQVAAGLRLGGWTGLPTRCWRCADVPDEDLWEIVAG